MRSTWRMISSLLGGFGAALLLVGISAELNSAVADPPPPTNCASCDDNTCLYIAETGFCAINGGFPEIAGTCPVNCSCDCDYGFVLHLHTWGCTCQGDIEPAGGS